MACAFPRPIGKLDAHRATRFDQDAYDIRTDADGPARRLDDRNQPSCESRCTADRIPATLQVMVDERCMHTEAGAAGQGAVVAPLRRKHRAQPRVGDALAQDLRCGASPPLAQAFALEPGDQGHSGLGHRVQNERCLRVGARLAQGGEPAVDVGLGGRERLLEIGNERLRRAPEREPEGVRILRDVVDLAHGRELDGAAREPVEHAPDRLAGAHPAEVVDTYIPREALALEGVREPAGHIVLLEHQHPFGVACQGRGAGQAADARADNDGVEARAHGASSITPGLLRVEVTIVNIMLRR